MTLRFPPTALLVPVRFAVVLLAVALSVSACGDSSDSDATTSNETTSRDTNSDSANSNSAATTDVQFQVFVNGGLMNIEFYLATFPQLAIDQDGVAWHPAPDRDHSATIPEVESKQLSDTTLQAVADLIGQSEPLFDPETDYGTPVLADSDDTTVTAVIDGKTSQVNVYALLWDTDTGDGRSRAELSTLVDNITQLIEKDPSEWKPQVPDQMLVLTFPIAGDPDSDNSQTWPEELDEPEVGEFDTSGCLVVSGSELEAILDEASDASISEPWALPSGDHLVVLRPVFLEPDCVRI